MKFLKVSLMLFAALVVAARACDSCAIYTASQAEGESNTGLFAGVSEQFTHFGTVQTNGHKEDNPTGQYLDSSVTQVVVGYSLNERFSLQTNIPIINRSYKRPDGFEIDRGTLSGVGDVSLLGNFLAFREDTTDVTFTLNLIGGVKFPTGDASRIKEELSETEVPGAPESGVHGHDLALGSGSFDGITGFTTYTRYQRMFFTTNFQYSIRSEGLYGYQYANEIDWSAGPGVYLLLEHEYTVSLQLVASGEDKGRDTFQGEVADDTGITSVYLGPQVGVTWENKLSADVGVDLPVAMQNSSFQAVPDYRIHAGITWRF